MKRWMHDEWTHSNVNFNDAEWGFIWRHHYEYGILTFSVWCVPSSTIERGKGEKSRRRTKKSLIFSLNFTFSSTHRNSMANFALTKAKNRKKSEKAISMKAGGESFLASYVKRPRTNGVSVSLMKKFFFSIDYPFISIFFFFFFLFLLRRLFGIWNANLISVHVRLSFQRRFNRRAFTVSSSSFSHSHKSQNSVHASFNNRRFCC